MLWRWLRAKQALLAAVGARRVHQSGTPAYRETKQARSKRIAATKHAVISQQLQTGHCEVNICPMAREDVEQFVQKLHAAAYSINTLKLRSIPRATTQLAYELAEQNDPRMSHKPPPLLSSQHKHGVCISSAHAQHQNVRFKLYASLSIMLANTKLMELELGMRLSLSGYTTLGKCLKRCETIKRLSFAGSHMGDAPLEAMQEGLCHNLSLEELDLTACNLTDAGMACLAIVIKHHAQRRANATFEAGLRQYPDPGLPPAVAYMDHHTTMRKITNEVDAQCGGWLHLEICENPQVGDRGALALRDALAFDRRMVLLSLRGCGLSVLSEREFVTLMREHQALERVDLRQCTGRGATRMGILKLNKGGAAALTVDVKLRTRNSTASSPALTVKSLALHQLLDGATTRKQGRLPRTLSMCSSIAPSECGSRPNRLHRNLSTVSWGDKQLLSVFGAQGGNTARGLGHGAHADMTTARPGSPKRQHTPESATDAVHGNPSPEQDDHLSSITRSCSSPTQQRAASKLSWLGGGSLCGQQVPANGAGGGRLASILKTGAGISTLMSTAQEPLIQDVFEQVDASDISIQDQDNSRSAAAVGTMVEMATPAAAATNRLGGSRSRHKKRGRMLISKSVTASPLVAAGKPRADTGPVMTRHHCSKVSVKSAAAAASSMGLAVPTASTSETIAEITGLLRGLELEVSKAEYTAQLARDARAQQEAEGQERVHCNITASKAPGKRLLTSMLRVPNVAAAPSQGDAEEATLCARADPAGMLGCLPADMQAQLSRWCSDLDAALQLSVAQDD